MTKQKHAGGRPTLYNDDLLEKARSYANGEWEQVGDAMPSIVGMCIYIGIVKATAYRWSNEDGKGQFKDILDHIMTKQENVLFNRSLTGDYNANIAKLALGKHGYHDKQDVETSGPGGKPVEQKWTVEVVGTKK